MKDAIEKGADINFVGDDLTTALQYAARNGNLAIVEYLVESGALFTSAFHYAAQNNHLEVVKYFIGKKVNIDEKQIDGMTALHSSAWMGSFETAIYLIENGANFELRDPSERTPLHMVADANYDGKITYLILLI